MTSSGCVRVIGQCKGGRIECVQHKKSTENAARCCPRAAPGGGGHAHPPFIRGGETAPRRGTRRPPCARETTAYTPVRTKQSSSRQATTMSPSRTKTSYRVPNHSYNNLCQACSHIQHAPQQLGTLGEPSKCPCRSYAQHYTLYMSPYARVCRVSSSFR